MNALLPCWQASSLVVVEHKAGQIAAPTFNTLTAAAALGNDVTALVAGKAVHELAQAAAQLPVVSKASNHNSFVGGVAVHKHRDGSAYAPNTATSIACELQ
jgi:electron transfer flavoprotein alpha subunit